MLVYIFSPELFSKYRLSLLFTLGLYSHRSHMVHSNDSLSVVEHVTRS